jgi:hypothetical protein
MSSQVEITVLSPGSWLLVDAAFCSGKHIYAGLWVLEQLHRHVAPFVFLILSIY